MPVTHPFVNPFDDEPGFLGTKPSDWNAEHTVSIVDADVDAAAAIAESKLALNHATHAAVTIGTANGLSLATQALSLGLASSGVTGALSGTDWDTFNGKQNALTLPLSSANGGTGVNNAGTLTNASNTTITGGGTVALGGFTLTVPATGTAALLATANVFTAVQKINVNSATAFLVEQDGVKDNTFVVDTASGYVGIGGAPAVNLEVFHSDVNIPAMRLKGTATSGSSGGAGIVALSDDGAALAPNDRLGYMLFGGSSDASSTIKNAAGIVAYSDNTWSGTSSPAYFTFETTPISSTTRVERLRIGSDGLITTKITATNTGVIAEALRIQATISTASTGGAAGFGPGLTFYGETATDGSIQQQTQISSLWVDATNASRKARLVLSVFDTATREGVRIQASGTAPMIGFYGVAAVARATTGIAEAAFTENAGGTAVNVDSTFGGYTLQQIAQALQSIGILT